MEGKVSNRYTSWLLLQLAEEGRPEEQMAQFFASMIISGDMQWYDITRMAAEILHRVTELSDVQGQIWPHLLPGGSNGDPLEHPDTERINEIVNMVKNEDSWSDIYDFLLNEGLVAAQETSALAITDEDVRNIQARVDPSGQGLQFDKDNLGQLWGEAAESVRNVSGAEAAPEHVVRTAITNRVVRALIVIHGLSESRAL
jgi:hypothetical protein